MARRELKSYLGDLLASGAVTAAAAVIGDAEAIACEGACGSTRDSGGAVVTTASLFDLASLTKPIVATLATTLDLEGALSLRNSVGGSIRSTGAAPSVAPTLSRKSLESLLRHRSGLQPWTPLFARCPSAPQAVPWLISEPGLLGAAPSTYSDLGYILWGWLAVQAVAGGLQELVEGRLALPLGLEDLGGPPGDTPGAVACRLDNVRERELAEAQGLEIGSRGAPPTGTPQDGNARFLGPSGHAGLFGSARAMWGLAGEWVRPRRILTSGAVSAALGGTGEYALGWRRRPPETRGRGGLWYGHLGFTGGGVWFSPESGEIRVLLAHRRSVAVRLSEWRRRFLEIPV